MIITTTLCIILVTTLLFGGSTMPLMKVIYLIKKNIQYHLSVFFQILQSSKAGRSTHRRRKDKAISLSKTKEWVIRINTN